MLSIFFGEINKDDDLSEKYIDNPDIYFDNQYEDEWITDDFSKKMVKSVDRSEIIAPHLVESPFLGPIPPERLSGGVKTLILINNDDEHIFNGSYCGDNCAEWILNICDKKDRTIRLGYIMHFDRDSFEIKIANTGAIVHNMAELTNEIVKNRLL